MKLINNTAKLTKPTLASVTLTIGITNGRDLDEYKLKRSWILTDTLEEHFEVLKNGTLLDPDETGDFEKFIFNLIPPELFNLYFFDGEKIADFFLEDGGNERIKNAFLTLCGYDTFEIMSKNFKRINSNTNTSVVMDEYLEAKQKVSDAKLAYEELKKQLEECTTGIVNCDAELKVLDATYSKMGGITQEQLDEKLAEIKIQEKKREALNSWLKKVANDLLPFLIVKNEIAQIQAQLNIEDKNRKYNNFCEVLNSDGMKAYLKSSGQDHIMSSITQVAFEQYGHQAQSILDLSFEDNALVMGQIKDILSFEDEKIGKAKKTIKTSLKKCTTLRQEIEKSSVDQIQNYMKKKTELLENKSNLLNNQIVLENTLHDAEENYRLETGKLEKVRIALEDELKKKSINDISSKAIIMLEKLQLSLYHKQIRKVETFFRKEINVLMRKTKFIDDIRIDDDFNIHIYRSDDIETSKLINILENIESNAEFKASITYKTLIEKFGSVQKAIDGLRESDLSTISVPVEIDKTLLSNGEKQIFIMALYHALVQLCNYEVPFIIDTPFARIDSEHRNNISKHFFSKLKGQVFILSTNEEIDADHVKIMKDKILTTYMLENSDNKRTTVVNNSYFGV